MQTTTQKLYRLAAALQKDANDLFLHQNYCPAGTTGRKLPSRDCRQVMLDIRSALATALADAEDDLARLPRTGASS